MKKGNIMTWFYTVVLLASSPLYNLSDGEAQAALKKKPYPDGKTRWDWEKILFDSEDTLGCQQGIIAYQGISREESIGKAAEMISTWKGGKENLPKIILWGIANPEDSIVEFKKELIERFETYFDKDMDNGGQIVLYTGLMINDDGEVVEYKE